MNWNDYFKMMVDWKKLPAYKAEPRIDSLIGYFLPQFIADFLSIEVVGIIPELPIRLGTVFKKYKDTKSQDRSYKVDFLIVGANGKNYLIEFKTDSKSRREGQDEYLYEAKEARTQKIIDGIIRIAKVSTYKIKYAHLLSKLREFGLIDSENKYSGINPSFEIIYIQPSKKNEEETVVDFLWISNWLEENRPNSEFETELAKALKLWSTD